MFKSPEFLAAEAHFAARLRSADFIKAHPEYLAYKAAQAPLADSLDPTIAQAFRPLMMFPSSVVEAVAADVEQAAAHRAATGGAA